MQTAHHGKTSGKKKHQMETPFSQVALMESFEAKRSELLEDARKIAVALAKKLKRPISMDDVAPLLTTYANVDNRFRGAVFRNTKIWEAQGYITSKRDNTHGRPLMTYCLIGA